MGGFDWPHDSRAILSFLRERIHKCWECESFADLFILPMLRLLEETWYPQHPEEAWATRVRRLRQQMGCTQAHLAQQLGVRREQIARWENGHHDPGDTAQQGLVALEAEVGS